MRELKEGLRIAVLHRQRYLTLIHTVLWDKEKETLDLYESVVSEFDNSVKAVLKVSHIKCCYFLAEVLVFLCVLFYQINKEIVCDKFDRH
jgi:hypothetical protein